MLEEEENLHKKKQQDLQKAKAEPQKGQIASKKPPKQEEKESPSKKEENELGNRKDTLEEVGKEKKEEVTSLQGGD